MTRLDATSEPSMEDILASIRKIIAEDPPGSRPALTPSSSVAAPQSQNAAPQPTLRAPERDPLAAFARRSDDALSAPAQTAEPYLKASPQKAALSEFGSEPFFAPRSAAPTPSSIDTVKNTSSSRIEPSFGPMSSASAQKSDFDTSRTAPEVALPAAGVSVDAQLSDLLGETAASATMPTASASGLGDLMAARPAQVAAANTPTAGVPMPQTPTVATSSSPQEARSGFTVSRDGFVAPTASMSTEARSTSLADVDPFEFDLGPSPFLAKPEAPTTAAPAIAPAPTGNSLTARMSASSLERITAPSAAASSIIEDHADVAIAADSIASPSADVAPTVDATPAAVVAAPSVAATLAPISHAQAPLATAKAPEPAAPSPAPPAPEPAGRFVPANASVEAPKPADRDVLEVVAPPRASSASAPIEVVRVAAEAEAPETVTAPSRSPASTAVAVHQADGHLRTMEETVAELLRPMLKTWLAENMPRIVERALRRELNEQMLLDKKDAAE